MKKNVFIVAVATLFLFSCQKENTPVAPDTDSKPISFKASIDQLDNPVKGTINASNQLVWAEGDLIGVHFPEWGDKNQPFRLNAADAGKTQGEFTIATAGNPSGASATAAYYPCQCDSYTGDTPKYPSSSQNNVYDGVMYFKLPAAYWSYSSEKMLTPLIAPITSASDNISFKHAGAAVKLTLNNLPEGTYKVKMSVTGKQITGDFHISPGSAGTAAMVLDATGDVSKNNITLNTWKSNGTFSWVFPVPELTKPKLQFEIKDENGVVVWSKNLKAQKDDLDRGDLLVMPAKSITPYEKFVQDNDKTWSFHGTINGSDFVDVPMVKDGKHWILSGFTFKKDDEFKIRKDNKWDESYPSSNWKFTDDNKGTKDIIFNSETHEISIVSHKYPYPTVVLTEAVSITDNSFSDWELIPGTTNGNTTLKVSSDDTYIYVYVQRDNNSAMWANSGYVYVLFDFDNDFSTNGTQNLWGKNGDIIALIYPFAGTSASPGFNAEPTSSWQLLPTTSTYKKDNFRLRGEATSSTATFELRIPRTDIPMISSTTPIAIKVTGSPSMDDATISRKL